MTVPIRTFGLKVSLFQIAQRVQGTANTSLAEEIDLTPLLGDGGSINTIKGIGDCAGGFTITFGDQYRRDVQDTAYTLVEPMDMIEIRASRNPEQYSGKKLPLIMRGFVSTVRRSEVMTAEGKPQRVVNITGQDFGKLWLNYAIWPELAYVLDIPLIGQYQLQAAFGIDPLYQPVPDFIAQFTQKVMNPKIAELSALSQVKIKPFAVDVFGVKEGAVLPQTASLLEGGPIWGVIEKFCDRPWNELFIMEGEEGPTVIFRPAPFYDVDRNLIGDATDPGTVQVDIANVVSLNVARSDNRVANFFWCDPTYSSVETSNSMSSSLLAHPELYQIDHANNLPQVFGNKRMDTRSWLTPDAVVSLPTKLPPGERDGATQNYVQWYVKRAGLLKLMNQDNVLFEEGEASLTGSENLIPGKYMALQRGSLTSQYYMTSISHSIFPLNTWLSRVRLERGTGYINRVAQSGLPYWSEGRPGVYPSGAGQ